jgi:hypothetical protein
MKRDIDPIPIDPEPVERLCEDFLDAIKAHYERRSRSAVTVLEVINSIASVAALVVSQTGQDGSDFFVDAFNAQMLKVDAETEH